MDISIIVSFDNNVMLMRNFIDGIMPFVEGREDRELVLASDRCRDIDTIEFSRECAAKWDNVKLVELPCKVGYSKANNFNDVTGNKRWFKQRGNKNDLIIDFYGNAFTVGQLGLC